MTRVTLTSPDQLTDLPDGTVLAIPGHEIRITWLRAYARAHPDDATGL